MTAGLEIALKPRGVLLSRQAASNQPPPSRTHSTR